MSKSKVLQVVGSFHQGGSERQAAQLVRMLSQAAGFDVRVMTLDASGVLRSDFEEFLTTEVLEFQLTSFYDLNFVRSIRRYVEFLRNEKIDLVQTYDFYSNVFGILGARIAGVPVRIASKRETGVMRTSNQERVEKLTFRMATRICANSLAVKRHLIKADIPQEHITVIHNGFDASQFDLGTVDRRKIATELGLPYHEGIRYISHVANMRHEVKNHPMVLRAAKIVLAENSDVHFVLAGEGDLMNPLVQMADDLGISANTHFIGRCTRVPELLSISYAGVLTSFAEGFSNSILEYMAAALPVVATNVGGANEVIDEGRSGYLIESDNHEGLAERLLFLTANPEVSFAMGTFGREVVMSEYSSETQFLKLTSLYRSELDRASNAGI